MDDAALVEAARDGDRDAFAAIYDRYADSIHDFSYSVLRDRDEAADVTQDTFLLAAEKLGQLRDPTRLRSWLFAIARHRAIRRGSLRARTVLTGEDADMPAGDDAGPDVATRRAELQQLVWDAAAGLSDRDRAILDLNVRQGLEGEELARALGVEPSHVYVMVNRLKAQVDRSLGALLVARHRRSDCGELAAILEGWDGALTPLVRKRVARHVESCASCSEGRKELASPVALLAAMPLVAAPVAAREHVLSNFDLISARRPVAAPIARTELRGWDRQGFPPGIDRPRSDRRGLFAVLAGVAALVLAAVLLAPSYDDTPTAADIDATATTTSTSAVAVANSAGGQSSVAPGTPPTAAAGNTATSGGGALGGGPSDTGGSGSGPNRPGNGVDGGTGDLPGRGSDTTVPPGTQPGGDTTGPTIRTSARPGRCTVELVAVVTDQSSITAVTATWRWPNGTESHAPMADQGGGTWSLTIGAPPPPGGDLDWSVAAADSAGNTANAGGAPVTVSGCSAAGPGGP